jgi:putative transposase
MDSLLDDYEDTGEVGRPRREPEEPQFLNAGPAEALIARAREEGVELLGEIGLLKQDDQSGARAGAG